MGFFDAFPVPESPEPARPARSRLWHEPGRNIVPATLVLDGLLVRRPELAVTANDFRVYPFGFGFAINVLRQLRRPGEDHELRTESPFRSDRSARGPQTEPLLISMRGGHGSNGFWQQTQSGAAFPAKKHVERIDHAFQERRSCRIGDSAHGRRDRRSVLRVLIVGAQSE